MIRKLSRRDQLTLKSLLGWSLVALLVLVVVGFSPFNVCMAAACALGFSNVSAWWICRREERQRSAGRR